MPRSPLRCPPPAASVPLTVTATPAMAMSVQTMVRVPGLSRNHSQASTAAMKGMVEPITAPLAIVVFCME